jgi:hypothetical protein
LTPQLTNGRISGVVPFVGLLHSIALFIPS